MAVLEDVLKRDGLAFHALHLGDAGDLAGTVAEALDLDDQVECARDLLTDRSHREVDARHQDHALDPGDRVARRVRVAGAERAVVAGVHRLQHVQRLGAAHLADDDPVGSHAQRVADQFADRDLALTLDVLRA